MVALDPGDRHARRQGGDHWVGPQDEPSFARPASGAHTGSSTAEQPHHLTVALATAELVVEISQLRHVLRARSGRSEAAADIALRTLQQQRDVLVKEVQRRGLALPDGRAEAPHQAHLDPERPTGSPPDTTSSAVSEKVPPSARPRARVPVRRIPAGPIPGEPIPSTVEAEQVPAHLIAQIEQLQQSVITRTIIGQAQGILMERHQLTADLAFALLSRASQHSNRKLRDIASDLVSTGKLVDPSHKARSCPPATSPTLAVPAPTTPAPW